MNVIEPIAITDAILTSTNVTEADHAAWAAGPTYAAGDRVIMISTHRIYESVVGGNIGVDPSTNVTGSHWINVGATNRWKAFDKLISDPVVRASPITYTLTPGILMDGVSFFGLVASSVRVKVTDPVDGVIYDVTRDIVDNSGVFDGWSYVFEPTSFETQDIFVNVPLYSVTVLEITISGSGTIKVGQIVMGRNHELGETSVGSSIGIEDFSRKDRDQFGNAILVERAFAQMVKFNFSFPTDGTRRVAGILARLRATPAVYHAGDNTAAFGTTVYGFYRDFDIPLTTTLSFATLEVEGLT